MLTFRQLIAPNELPSLRNFVRDTIAAADARHRDYRRRTAWRHPYGHTGRGSMSGIRIERIDTPAALQDIKSAWTDCERADGYATVFQSWTWNSIWCEQVLAREKRARIAVRLARDGAGRILAIFPFFEQQLAASAIQLTRFIGHRMFSDGGILLADPGNGELTARVVAAVLKDLGSRTILHLSHLNGAAPFTRCLVASGLAQAQCPRLWIATDGTDTDPAARLGSKMRKNLRSIRNRMQREFKTEFRAVSGADYRSAFDEFVDLHQRRFAAKHKSSSLTGRNLAFLKAATSQLSDTGQFEILQLRADGKTIAAQLMARDKQRYSAIQGGFAPEYSRFSPTLLLDLEGMRRGFHDLGCTTYDLGAGYEAYKYHWKPSVGTDYFCCCGVSNLYARSLAALYRMALKRALPPLPKDLAWDPSDDAKAQHPGSPAKIAP
jgi:CelD/BcsL family acetyltransferase involved in cellulose biosynthesis